MAGTPDLASCSRRASSISSILKACPTCHCLLVSHRFPDFCCIYSNPIMSLLLVFPWVSLLGCCQAGCRLRFRGMKWEESQKSPCQTLPTPSLPPGLDLKLCERFLPLSYSSSPFTFSFFGDGFLVSFPRLAWNSPSPCLRLLSAGGYWHAPPRWFGFGY